MTQDQTNNQGGTPSQNSNPANAAGQNKRHYREIGSPGQQASGQPEKRAGNGPVRSGGNRPPRNQQRQSADNRSGADNRPGNAPGGAAAAGSSQRPRRSRNRRPSGRPAGQQGPMERADRGGPREQVNQNETRTGRPSDPAAEPVRMQPASANTPSVSEQSGVGNQLKKGREGSYRAGSRSSRQSMPSGKPARWEKKVRAEETYEDIHRDIERIEKEIWLEIASIHTIKLDF